MASKKTFINDDFLLTTKAAKELYHRYAEKMPIIDYHCHLPPVEIAEDKRWTDIAQVWLGGDHYKWRQMRSNGVEERFCTGDASWHDKFVKFAETMERLVRNPLFDWSHLELARYFGVTEILNAKSAERIWKKCNAKLAGKGFSARGLMKKSNVKVVCTTRGWTSSPRPRSCRSRRWTTSATRWRRGMRSSRRRGASFPTTA